MTSTSDSDGGEQMLTEIRFWAQVLGDARRIVLCPPDLESRIKGWVDGRGVGGLIEVRADWCCPDGRILVVDPGALAAYQAQSLQRLGLRGMAW